MLDQCDLMSFESNGSMMPHSSLLGDDGGATGLCWYTVVALASSDLAAKNRAMRYYGFSFKFGFLLLFYCFIDACLQPGCDYFSSGVF